MGTAKIQFSVGTLSFSAEAEEKWVNDQLDKILAAVPSLVKTAPAQSAGSPSASTAHVEGDPTVTLAKHLKDKGAEQKQVRRFLATADWLRLKGQSNLTTSAVAKALSDNHQSRLGNPADCLIQNIAKGFCEKQGNSFYITPEGLKELGYS